jgi:phosphoglycolate phosphatase
LTKQLVVFDLDGTLVDSGQVVSSILNKLRQKIGKQEKPVSYFTPWLSLGGLELVENGLGVDELAAESLLSEFRAQYAEISTPSDTVYQGVFDVLNHLLAQNIKMCICTNKPRNLAEKVLSETGLARYFEYVCAGGDLPTKKPHPRNLAVCVEFFGIHPQQVAFVGDSSIDQKLAAALSVDFYFFTRGYDDGVDRRLVSGAFENHLDLRFLFNKKRINNEYT